MFIKIVTEQLKFTSLDKASKNWINGLFEVRNLYQAKTKAAGTHVRLVFLNVWKYSQVWRYTFYVSHNIMAISLLSG